MEYFIVFGIPILIILMLISIKRSKKKYINEESINKYIERATERAVKKNIKYIKCDSCGEIIELKKSRVCPHCGAAFNKDKELQTEIVDSELQKKCFESYMKSAEKRMKKRNKSARIIIYILLSILLIVSICTTLNEKGYMFGRMKSDDIPSGYTKVDYEFDSDTVILNDNKIKIEMLDIYKKESSFLVRVQITNKEKDMYTKPSFAVKVLNGVEKNIFFFEEVKGNKPVVRNLMINTYQYDINNLNRLVIDNIHYSVNMTDYTYEKYYKVLTTNAEISNDDYGVTLGRKVYSENNLGIDFYVNDYTGQLILMNESDNNYSYEMLGGTINGKKDYGDCNFYGTLFNNSMTYSRIKFMFENYAYNDEVELENFGIDLVITDLDLGNIYVLPNIYVEMLKEK